MEQIPEENCDQLPDSIDPIIPDGPESEPYSDDPESSEPYSDELDDEDLYDDMPEIDLNLERAYRDFNGPRRDPRENFSQSDSFEFLYFCRRASLAGISHLEYGNQIVLPPSALSRLLLLQLEYPMLFEIQNQPGKRVSHCGVREFTGDEGCVILPDCMMENLQVEEGDFVDLKLVKLGTGSYLKLQPHSPEFLNISNPRVVLEKSLRNFSCLTTGDTIVINYNNKDYRINVVETKPDRAVSIIDTDCEVAFAPPLNFEQPLPVEETKKEDAGTVLNFKYLPHQIFEKNDQPTVDTVRTADQVKVRGSECIHKEDTRQTEASKKDNFQPFTGKKYCLRDYV